jgi:hypothetical protein
MRRWLHLLLISAFVLASGPSATAQPASAQRPLIVIPGIMGSVLQHRALGSAPFEIWPAPLNPAARSFLGASHAAIVATDLIRSVAIGSFYEATFYAPLIDRLTLAAPAGGGYTEYTAPGAELLTPLERCEQSAPDVTLFTFAYDWRGDNAASAAALAQLVACVSRLHPGAPIDIVAHSMGGLAARRYLIDHAGDHRIGRLITVGTPWLGAAGVLPVLESGWYTPAINALVPPHDLKRLAARFPGLHQLAPSRSSFLLDGPALYEDGRDLNGNSRWFVTYERYSFDQYVAVLDARYGAGVGSGGAQFHTVAQDDWRGAPLDVEAYHFVGSGARDDTLRAMRSVWRVSCNPQQLGGIRLCAPLVGFDVSWGRGDGVVTFASAARRGAGFDLNAPNATVIPVTSGTADHTGMLGNPFVLDAMLAILRGAAPPKSAPAEPPAESYYLRFSGVLALSISDDAGNRIDADGAARGAPAPGATIIPLGDGAYAVSLPADESYTIQLRAGADPLTIVADRGASAGARQALRYLDTALPPGAALQLRVTPQEILPLRYDAEGDAVYETQIAPDSAAAADVDPPRLSVDVAGPRDAATVTVTAQDAGVGVAAIYYSLDGKLFSEYTGTLQIDTRADRVIYLFADDAAANRSPLAAYALVGRAALPLVQQ